MPTTSRSSECSGAAPAEDQEKGPTRREAVGPGLNSGSSGGKAGTAPAAAGRVGVGKGETGALHRGHVVDGDAGEILRAEPVHEDPHAIDGVYHVVFQGALFDVEAVLEARAATRKHADAKAGRLDRDLLLGDELLHLFSSPFGQRHAEAGGGGLLLDAIHE